MPLAASAKYPSAIALAADLLNQKNLLSGTTIPVLSVGISAGATSLTVASAGTGAAFPTDNFEITIDSEIIFVASRSGDTLNGLVRGAEGTTAASHSAGVQVNAFMTALAHNQLAAEINAVETALGFNLSNVVTFRRTVFHATDGSTSTFQNLGEPAPSFTASTLSPKTFATGAGPSIEATTNLANTPQGFTSPAANYKIGKNISFYATAWANSIVTQRSWFGLTDQSLATMLASDNPAGNYAAFRFSSIGSDTTYQCIVKDGTTQTIVSTGVAPINDVLQTFQIIFNDTTGTVYFFINGALVATITTHLPTTGTSVSWLIGGNNSAGGSFQNGVAVGQVIIQCDTP